MANEWDDSDELAAFGEWALAHGEVKLARDGGFITLAEAQQRVVSLRAEADSIEKQMASLYRAMKRLPPS